MMRFGNVRQLARVLTVAALTLGARSVGAQTPINFDDLPASLGGGAAIGGSYKGLAWEASGTPMGWITQGNANYTDIVCRSGSNCGYNGFGLISGMSSSTPITLSGWIRRWNWSGNTGSAVSVLIEGLNAGGSVVASQTIALTGTYQAFSLSSLFTTVRITPTGGSGLGCSGPTNCGYYLIDDLTVNPVSSGVVPEPSTYALMATGLLGLVGVSRSRRRNTK